MYFTLLERSYQCLFGARSPDKLKHDQSMKIELQIPHFHSIKSKTFISIQRRLQVVSQHNLTIKCNVLKLIVYSGVHKRSDAYSSLLSKPQLFSMAWWTFKMLLPTWQAGSKQILIGGFQKGRTCPCISRDTKVADCQTFFIFQKSHFSFCISYCHMKTAPPINTFDFFKY